MGKYYVAQGNEICTEDPDGDDVVIAICGAKPTTRSHQYSMQSYADQKAMAQRIVDLLNAAQETGR